MKIAVWILGILVLFQLVMHQLHINNAFVATLDVRVDTSRTFVLAPGDSVVFMVPFTNNSWKDVELIAASGTCNVESIRAPERFVKKRIYNVPVSLVAPDAPGEYADAVVLRTSGDATFYGSDILFRVEESAERADTLWMGREPERFIAANF